MNRYLQFYVRLEKYKQIYISIFIIRKHMFGSRLKKLSLQIWLDNSGRFPGWCGGRGKKEEIQQ